MSKTLTQKKFANSLGIAQGFLSELERGIYKASKTLLIAIENLYQINISWLLTGEGDMEKKEVVGEIKEVAPGYVTPGEPVTGITGDYPLIKKLMGEVEDAARLGLTEEELTDLLMNVLEGELIKQRRRPIPEPEPEYEAESRLATIVRDILEKETPPQDLKERRKCMIDLANFLGFSSDDTQSIQLP